MELLSYPSLDQAEESQIQSFLAEFQIVNIDNQIKQVAIALRKRHRLKLPDAVIVATAQSLNAILLTNDLKLSDITSLQIQSLPIR